MHPIPITTMDDLNVRVAEQTHPRRPGALRARSKEPTAFKNNSGISEKSTKPVTLTVLCARFNQ